MNNQILKRLFIGFKKGLLTPTLPDNIIKLQNYPLIRIISFLLIVSKSYLNYSYYILYPAMFFALLFRLIIILHPFSLFLSLVLLGFFMVHFNIENIRYFKSI